MRTFFLSQYFLDNIDFIVKMSRKKNKFQNSGIYQLTKLQLQNSFTHNPDG